MNRAMWSAWSQGSIDDAEAQRLAELIEERRGGRRPLGLPMPDTGNRPKAPQSIFRTGRVPPRSPDRQRSIERRRRLAATGPLPPVLAASFTTGEIAVLRIIGDRAGRGGCELSLGEIAGRAGVSVSTARRAVRGAQRQGLVKVEERRRYRAPSLTNVITIVSREWKTWLDRGPKRSRGEGFKADRPRIPVLGKGAHEASQKPTEGLWKRPRESSSPPRRRR